MIEDFKKGGIKKNMVDKMFRRGLIFGIIILFIGGSIIGVSSSNIRRMGSVNSETIVKLQSSDDSMLDTDFIKSLTENLSYIIFTEYNESAGELAMGRAFGTKGEHKAAEILYENMTKLGLYTTKVPIQNITEKQPYLTCKLEVLAKGLTVKNKSSQVERSIVDCYISPRWNLTGLLFDSSYSYIKDFFSPVGFFDRKYNIYDLNRLTHNFSEKDLEIIRRPTHYSLIRDIIRYFKNNKPFVYFAENPSFNPNHPAGPTIGPLYERIFKILKIDFYESALWYLFYSNCKGIILYDYTNNAYDMNNNFGNPLPVIYINGTIGNEINNSVEDFTIDFYINQHWNESVETYNVIGQLNGTDPSKTIVICSLYDSWWCQATGDSAIGMSMVLGIAKYFIDHNITPRYNIKFCAFSGEEYNTAGARYYEGLSNETIPVVIDLNQLGFRQIEPRVALKIITNNKSLVSTLGAIGNETNYVERTGNITDFWVGFQAEGGPSNSQIFALAENRSCNTILFLKGNLWPLHHRDGEGHTKGDVMDYYDERDVRLTSEMIWNITKYFTVNPDCWFENDSFISVDSPDDGDYLNDSINATFIIKTSISSDHMMINASLIKGESTRSLLIK